MLRIKPESTALMVCLPMLLVASSAGFAQGEKESAIPDLSGAWDSIGWFGGFDRSPYASPVFSAEGQAMKSAYNDETDNPVYDCTAPGLPNILIVPYMIEITQHEDKVVIRHEYFDSVRLVHLDRDEHPGDADRTLIGYSIGRYEGNSLVVDTRNFSFDRIGADMNGGPTGEEKKVIERYTRSADGQTLHVEFGIEDPEFLDEPYVREREYRYAPNQEIYDFECEPEYASKTREMYRD